MWYSADWPGSGNLSGTAKASTMCRRRSSSSRSSRTSPPVRRTCCQATRCADCTTPLWTIRTWSSRMCSWLASSRTSSASSAHTPTNSWTSAYSTPPATSSAASAYTWSSTASSSTSGRSCSTARASASDNRGRAKVLRLTLANQVVRSLPPNATRVPG